MARSGIDWIDAIFDWCVTLLVEAARLLGITYEEINVWLFCVIWPALTLLLLAWNVALRRRLRRLRRAAGGARPGVP
ncbi:MAG: hypothetical protein R3F55_20755 [Alphaproteobacteria bacterium]